MLTVISLKNNAVEIVYCDKLNVNNERLIALKFGMETVC